MAEPFDFQLDESWSVVREILELVSGEKCPGVDVLRGRWEEKKERLLRVLGPTGRITALVNTTNNATCSVLDEPELGERIKALLLDYTAEMELDCSDGSNYEVKADLTSGLAHLFQQVSVEELAENKLASEREDPRPSHKGKKIPAGTRVGKFARIWLSCNLRESCCKYLELAVNVVSRVSQFLRSQEGTVCVLSVNPLDVLLASEHTTGWSSCHSLDGSYCTGPLAYLLDGCTAVAYAYVRQAEYEDTRKILPVKLWRQMVYFDLEAGSAAMSREYPGEREEYSKTARRLVARALATAKPGASLENWTVLRAPTCVQVRYVDLGWHYRDTLSARVSLKDVETEVPTIRAGVRELPCLACGDDRTDGAYDNLLCPHCGDYNVLQCDHCGGRVFEDDGYNVADGSYICETCFEEHYARCSYCDEIYCRADVFIVNHDFYCEDCFERLGGFCCDVCGRAVLEGVHAGEAAFCKRCASSRVGCCEMCGDNYVIGDAYEVVILTKAGPDTAWFCEQCVEDKCFQCLLCGEMFISTAYNPGTDGVCRECEEVRKVV